MTLGKITANLGAGWGGLMLAVQSVSYEQVSRTFGLISLIAGTVVTLFSAINAINAWRRDRGEGGRRGRRPRARGGCGRSECSEGCANGGAGEL